VCVVVYVHIKAAVFADKKQEAPSGFTADIQVIAGKSSAGNSLACCYDWAYQVEELINFRCQIWIAGHFSIFLIITE